MLFPNVHIALLAKRGRAQGLEQRRQVLRQLSEGWQLLHDERRACAGPKALLPW